MADGKVVIDTELDSSGALGGIKKMGSSIASGAASTVKSVAKIGTAAVAAGATAAGALTKSAVDAYASYEQLVGGIETLFGAGGQSAKEYAKSVGKSTGEAKKDYEQLMHAQNIALKNADKSYKTAGLSANDYMETVTSFAASLKQSTKNETEAAKAADQIVVDMSDNANKMGTDMEMIQNAYNGFSKQNYTMLDNLKLGYGGTQAEMQRLLQDAEKLSGQHYELGNFKDMAEAIHVVQTEMGITGTTAKEASTTIEGSVNSAKAAWENLMVGLADDDADFDKLVNNFVDSVATAASNILPRVEKSLEGISDLIEKLIPVIVGKVPDIIEKLLPKLLQSGTKIVLTIVQGMVDAIPTLLEVLPEIISQIGGALKEAAPELMTSILDVLNQLGQYILETLPDILDDLSSIFDDDSMLDTFLEMGLDFIENLGNGIIQSIPQLEKSAINLVTNFIGFITRQFPNVLQTGLNLVVNLATGVLQGIPTLIGAVPGLIDSLVNTILENIPTVINAGTDLISSLVDNLPEIIDKIVEVVPEIISNLLDAIFEHLPDIADAGFNLLTSLADDLPFIIETLIKAIFKLVKGLVKAIIESIPKMAKAGFKLLGSLFKNLPGIIAKLLKVVPSIIKAIKDGFAGYAKDMMEIGKNIIGGIWKGMKSAGSWLKDKVTGFCGDVVGNVKDFFGIASPSKLMRDEVGRYIAQGIWVGFDKDNPMKQINDELKYGMRKLDTTMTLSGGYYSGIDYDRLGQATVDAFTDANIGISVGSRQFGRLVKEAT